MLNKKYRLLVCVEYCGYNYIGWQKQLHSKLSIQEIIEECLSKIAKHKIKIFSSSRTDSGVNSLGQMFHFDTFCYKKEKEWLLISNFNLPRDITFKSVKYVKSNFHARYNVYSRRYLYIILNSNIRSSFLNNRVMYYLGKISISLMLKASKFLLGKHNFISFQSSGCESKNTYKNIMHLNIFRINRYIIFDIKADSFLYRMIRNIISNLLLIGMRKFSVNWIKYVLSIKKKGFSKNLLVKPYGLYLYKIEFFDFF